MRVAARDAAFVEAPAPSPRDSTFLGQLVHLPSVRFSSPSRPWSGFGRGRDTAAHCPRHLGLVRCPHRPQGDPSRGAVMSARVHVHLIVSDIEESRGFYEKFLDAKPVKVRSGYVKFLPHVAPVNLALSESNGDAVRGRPPHLGIQVDSTEEVQSQLRRVKSCGLPVREEMGVDCCHANPGQVLGAGSGRIAVGGLSRQLRPRRRDGRVAFPGARTPTRSPADGPERRRSGRLLPGLGPTGSKGGAPNCPCAPRPSIIAFDPARSRPPVGARRPSVSLVKLEIRDRIAIITLDNPPVNALSAEGQVEMYETFE